MSRDDSPMVPSLEDFESARVLVESFIPRACVQPVAMMAIATLTAGAMIARAIYRLEFTLRRER